jgi:colicin import membrane protein
MNKLLVWTAAAALVHGALAQDAEDPAVARARISRERGEVEAAYKVKERACYQTFAVNDCLKEARSRRRDAMADLKRQETSLNDAERKRKGAERQRVIEERASVEKRAAQAGQPAQAGPQGPGMPAGPTIQEKQAERARAQERNAADAADRQREQQVKQREKEAELARRKEDAARNAQRLKKEQAQAEEHKASVNKRLAERSKPPAQPLPPPP